MHSGLAPRGDDLDLHRDGSRRRCSQALAAGRPDRSVDVSAGMSGLYQGFRDRPNLSTK
jgi:hypothetical protein